MFFIKHAISADVFLQFTDEFSELKYQSTYALITHKMNCERAVINKEWWAYMEIIKICHIYYERKQDYEIIKAGELAKKVS